MSTIAAIVKSLVGQVFAVSIDGLKRQIFEGERLLMGEQVLTGLGGEVTLQLANGELVSVGQNSNWQAGPDANASDERAPDSELEQALAAGFDPTTDLEAPAAGAGTGAGTGGAAGGGHSFVLLDETGQQLDPTIGFDTAGLGFSFENVDEEAGRNIEQDSFINGTPPTVSIPNDGLGAGNSDLSVVENATVTGSFTISAPDGLTSLTLGGTLISAADLADSATTNVVVTGSNGTLTVTGFNATTGVVSYSYDPTGTSTDNTGTVIDSFAVVVTDPQGDTQVGSPSLDILITDTAPVANADTRTVGEDDTGIAGNLVTGTNATADTQGADTATVTGLQADNAGSTEIITGTGGTGVAGTYGTLIVNANGSYSYVTNAAAQALVAGASETDTFSYTLKDSDGSFSTTTVTFTINGATDGPPTIVPVDGNAAATGQATVNEIGLLTAGNTSETTTGTITVTAADGLASVVIGGTTFTAANLADAAFLAANPIDTGEGTLTLTGFNAGTGALSYSYTLKAAIDQQAATESTDAIDLVVNDLAGGNSTGTLTVQIIDGTPVAVNDVNAITEDTVSVTGNVLTGAGADTVGADTNANPVTAGVLVSTNGYGTLTLNSNGSYSYALNNSNATVNALNDDSTPLTDSFTYTLTDGDGSSTTATLTITINGRTDGPPTVTIPDTDGALNTTDSTLPETAGATAGSFTVAAEAGITSISVGGTVLTLTQLNALGTTPVAAINTGEGSLQITAFNAATGVVSYTYDPSVLTHTAGAAIVDSIAVSVTDANGISRSDNLDIAITDSTPTAVNDVNAITEDTVSVTGNVLTGAGADTVGADTNANPVTAGVLVSTNGYGTLTLNSNGSYSYALNNSNATVNALNDDSTPLTDSFTYTLTDGDGSSTTATLTITINGRTDGPPTVTIPDTDGALNTTDSTLPETAGATAGSFTVAAEAGITSISVGGTVLTLTQLNALGTTPVAAINTGEGSLQITAFNAATGVVSYTYDPSVLTHTAGAAIVDSIAVSVTDANGISRSDNLDIAITDSTPTAVNDVNAITEDTVSVTGNVLTGAGADTVGADTNANPVTAGVLVSTNGYGTLTLNSNGSYSYALNNSNATVNALNDDSTPLTDSFTYTLTDGDGSSTTATLTITINGRTDGPPTVTIPDTDGALNTTDSTLPETAGATAGSFTVAAEAGITSISVGGTVLTLTQLNALGTTPVAAINTGEGSLQITAFNAATGVVSYTYDPSVLTHTAGAAIVDSIAVSVTDANGISRSDNLDIAITDSTPTAVNDVNAITEDTVSVTGNVLTGAGADTVGADTNANPVTAGVLVSTNGYGTLTLNSNGSYSYALNNSNATVNALNDDSTPLTDSFTYTLTDGDGSSTTATLTITINGRTDGPPTVTIPDTDGALNTTDSTLPETAGATAGSFTVAAEAGITSISVGGTVLTLTQLNALGTTPVAAINTGEGSLQITAFNAATGVVSYTYDPSVLTHTAGAAIVDSIAVSVTDANGISRSDNLDIAITDSTPTAVNDSITVTENSVQGTVNLVLVLDTSGSMGSGTSSTSRLGIAKAALQNLIDQYGDAVLQVKIVSFNSAAQAEGAAWLSASAAKTTIGNISGSGNNTDYDDALAFVQNNYGTPTPADATYVYFLSDGQPVGSDNGNSNAISETERSAWTEFLADNQIDAAYAVGISITGDADKTQLDSVAWSPDSNPAMTWSGGIPVTSTAHNVNTVVVTDVNDLADALTNTVSISVTGNLLTGIIVNNEDTFGADGSGVQKIVGLGLDTDGDGNVDIAATFNAGTYTIDLGATIGNLTLDANTGEFSFNPVSGYDISRDQSFKLIYTIEDNDGSRDDGVLTLNLKDASDVNAYDNYTKAVVREVAVPGTTTNLTLANFDSDDLSNLRESQWVFDNSGANDNVVASNPTSSQWQLVGTASVDTSNSRLTMTDSSGGTDTAVTTPTFTVASGNTATASFDIDVRGSRFSSGDTFSWRLIRESDGQAIQSGTQNSDAAVTTSSIAAGTYRLVYTLTDNTGGNGQQNAEVRVDSIVLNTTGPAGTVVAGLVVSGNVITDANYFVGSTDLWGAVDSLGSEGAALTAVNGTGVAGSGTTSIAGAYGTLTIAANGSYGYTPTANLANIGQSETFTYTLTQPDGSSDSANLVIKISDTAYTVPTPIEGNSANLVGTSGDDVMIAGDGNNILTAGGGNDHLEGGAGSDQLLGEEGNDILIGGSGDDILTGGSGADRFVWHAGDTGNDKIMDLSISGPERDTIDLRDLLQGETTATIDNYLQMVTDSGTSTLLISTTGNLNAGGGAAANADTSIELTGVNLSGSTINSLIAGADPLIKIDNV
ncbi:retention module-containing protein [Pseudomonas sp. TMP25]|uniref:retention module-containing protein n=1 Tax=Pseudomonas sp. TMP25 TaxID=3136561 RepID=UPI003101630D